ncbi:MAG: DUF3501 family protein [Acidimicrobiales bacterium]|jgi:hypothetical protein|nr:DUF3501 family protein [Acidimicrobiales bacterium]MDP6287938.1 DUF3501 family protein [Acidimicrobiales bacterium]MDP6910524.1 DUF3501 family protein [Acidimicrobiales bacterium]|tara:strand:+ start:42 stop:626 length:585 start_codon:yes stop_codon:yes gene_type:complete
MTDYPAPAPHHVRRDEILDWQTYADNRDAVRAEVMTVKAVRRIHLGEHLTFLFENHDTMRYQVHEIMRAERIVRETSIHEELETYNGMLGGAGQLGCALLIEIEDEAERRPLLEAWLGLQECLYAETADGSRIYAEFDPTQVGRGRLSAVQYLNFSLESGPVRLGSDFAALELTVDLTEAQRAALAADLAATRP